jgi:N-methylhydantoinase B/oxoprolinase/acetone carboxylase alpha subunit
MAACGGLNFVLHYRERCWRTIGASRRLDWRAACAGEVGSAWLTRANGSVAHIGATASFTVEAGDVLTIQTPGGGGFGTP